MSASVITLLTDFGTADGYVAELKGVLVTRAPGVPLLDLSHEVPPQDVAFARLTVARYWRRFPVGTVHLIVVDPGVGTARAAIAVASEGRFLVGPDNGVLSPALFALDARAVALTVDPLASPTFHGRDVFAPAAAHLARGGELEEIGEPYGNPLRLRTPQPQRGAGGVLHGEVLTIDRFGNALTNLAVREAGELVVEHERVRMVRTYGEAMPGELVGVVGSNGFVEVAVREGSAAQRLTLRPGTPVQLWPRS
jgi:hypothetical protein